MKNKTPGKNNILLPICYFIILSLSAMGGWFLAHYISRSNETAYAVTALETPPPFEMPATPVPFILAPTPLPDFVVAATPTPTPIPYIPPRILFAGDFLLDNSVRTRINRFGLDSVFEPEHRTAFLEADICMLNLEMPFSYRGTAIADKEWTFRGTPEHVRLLKDMNIHIVSIANNHTLDYGMDAFLDTLEILHENEIRYVGGGRDLDEAKRWETFEVSGKTFAFLAASRVIPTTDWYAGRNRPGHLGTYDPTVLNEQITLAKKEADYVFVYVHWGVERSTIPERWQRNMAYGYIDAGADAVIGCHAHVLQGFETYNDKLIAYNLGNFIFTSSKLDTAALEFTVNEDGELNAKLYPYEIIDRATKTMDDTEKLEALRRHLNDISFNTYINENFEITWEE